MPRRALPTTGFVRTSCQIPEIAVVRVRPGRNMPMKESTAPAKPGVLCVDETARAPRYTAKLKFGPGNAWMMANPMRKSREDTQPG
jgi:hypothetical protein